MSIYDEILPKYQHPTSFDSGANFAGTIPTEYIIYSRHRDSCILDTCNFEEILKDLGGESDHVKVIRHGHWACGWIEYLAVKTDSPTELLDRCGEILRALDSYPVYDDDRYSERQFEAICDYWHSLPLRNRVDLCRKNRCSIFAARHDDVPNACWEYLREDIY